MFSIPTLRSVFSVFGQSFYFNGNVLCQAVNGNSLYVGGTFSSVGCSKDEKVRYATVINSIDASHNSNVKTLFNGDVFCSLILGQYVYIGGSFTTYNNIPCERLVKISLLDGSIDTTFNTNSGFNGPVYAISLDNSGNLYIGGSFTTYKGTARQRIAKINANTAALDTTFDTTTGFNTTVFSIALDNSGNLYAGGSFTTYKGTSRQYLAKINANTAAIDNTFDTSTGFNTTVFSIALDNSGNLYAGGDFTTYKGTASQRIAKIDRINATLDTIFDTTTGFSSLVRSIALDNSANLYVGGSFTTYKGITRQRIAKLNSTNAALDSTFDTSTGFNNSVYEIELDNSGNLYVGGIFSSYKGINRLYIAKINANTAGLDTTFNTSSGCSATVYAISLDNSTNLFVGGQFEHYKSVNNLKVVQNIVKINLLNGSVDSDFNTTTGFNSAVNSIILDNSGNLYVGGNFTFYKSTVRQYIAKLNANTAVLDTTFNTSSGFNGAVNSIALDNSGNLYAGGSFTTYKGIARQAIAKINANTAASDTTFDTTTGCNSIVNSIALDNSGNLYAGGSFTTYKGTSSQYIVKVNGITAALDSTFDTGSGFNNVVYAIVLDNLGNLYVGGIFNSYKGINRSFIAKINVNNGALDTTFDTSTGFNDTVRTIALDNSGNLYAGGIFSSYKGINRHCIAKINATNATLDTNFNLSFGLFDNTVRTIIINNLNNLCVGGQFSNYNVYKARYFAILNSVNASIKI